ncbi:hypothetical protein [Gulosibacter bifidus]|uniref:Uncharacterized protein n=1 Tax=Gulosibacter bifidus TaxID=272239 RepID=A0ABW5RK90_9MICO|nr:hypothetical protein [Gulosibacter bifidus]
MITAALNEVRDALKRAGITSHADPKRVPIPGAWLNASEVRTDTLDGSCRVRVDVHLVVRDQSATGAIRDLEALLLAAMAVIEPDGEIETAEVLQTDRYALPCFVFPVFVTTSREV